MADYHQPLLIEYPLNESTSFFLCRHCRTPLASLQHIHLFYFGTAWILIRDLVNVRLDEDQEISNGQTTVRSIYCKTCSAELGFKLVYLQNEDQNVRAGRYLLDRRRLLIWYRNKMHDVLTLKPA